MIVTLEANLAKLVCMLVPFFITAVNLNLQLQALVLKVKMDCL